MTKRKLTIDRQEFDFAADSYPHFTGYLDLETGTVETLASDAMLDDIDDFHERLEEDFDRYEQLPRPSPHDDYRAMCRFAETVDEGDIREKLAIALDGRGAFGRFRNVLHAYPDLRSAWEQSQREARDEELKVWFDGIGIEPVWVNVPELQVVPTEPTPAKKKGAIVVSLFELLTLGGPPTAEDGKVYRRVEVKNARQTFKSLARELCEIHGIGWRKRFIADQQRYEVEGIRLEHGDRDVSLAIPIRPEVETLFKAG